MLILKFSEVLNDSKEIKVFDVVIGEKVVVPELDIYSKVGKGVAYDEFIELFYLSN